MSGFTPPTTPVSSADDLQPSLYRMSPSEVAWGWVPGVLEATEAPPRGWAIDPLGALEEAIRPALRRPPCLVQFSGGRDSSLVLAVALRLARREGLDDPVALTHRFPGLDETHEQEWQELVVAHLGVRQWERVEVAGELDLIGPTAAASLGRHGLLWPPALHTRPFDFTRTRGGSILDGEGGDEVLGPGRTAVVSALASGRLPPSRSTLKALALALAPRPARRRAARLLYRRQLRPPWLRSEAWRALESAVADDFAGEPLDRRRSLLRHRRLRMVALFVSNCRKLAQEHGVLDVKPLLDTGFLVALGGAGGRFGFPGRTTAMTGLFGDLLPAELLTRSDKAQFNRVAFNAYSRRFVAHWDGSGVDEELVDTDALRLTWAEERPNALSFALLQAAWLASQQQVPAP